MSFRDFHIRLNIWHQINIYMKRKTTEPSEVNDSAASYARIFKLSRLVTKAPGELEVCGVVDLRADEVVDTRTTGVAVSGYAGLAPDAVATLQRLGDRDGVSRGAVVLKGEAVVGVGGVALAKAVSAGRAVVGSLAVDAQFEGERAMSC